MPCMPNIPEKSGVPRDVGAQRELSRGRRYWRKGRHLGSPEAQEGYPRGLGRLKTTQATESAYDSLVDS